VGFPRIGGDLLRAPITAFLVLEARHPTAARIHLDTAVGTANTALLLTSSLTMALLVKAVLLSRRRATRNWLLCTLGLGAGFMAIKVREWMSGID
jgi:cytochrome c oxidase subunit 3